MKTIEDIRDMVKKFHHEDTRTQCKFLWCERCSKNKWCFCNYNLLTMDYLNRGYYYG